MAYTGNQGTLTNAGGWVGAFVSIGDLTQQMPDLEGSELGTTTYGAAYRGQLIDLEPIPCDVLYDPDTPPPMIAAEQWILTFPIPSGANIVGTGFITEVDAAELVNNNLMRGGFMLQFDGKVGPLIGDSSGSFSVEFSGEFV